MTEKRKKILYVITKSNWGGAQRHVFDLATLLTPAFETVVALGGNGKLVEMLRAHHVRTIPIAHLKRDISFADEVRSFMQLYSLLRTERPDILHLHSSKAGALGALAGRLARVPCIVFTAHGWAWNEDRGRFSKLLVTTLHWLTVQLAHRTIAVSHSIYDQMAAYPLTKYRMRVLHSGITPPPLLLRDQARATLMEQKPILAEKKGAFWMVSIAELHHIKGLKYALEAVALLKKKNPDIVYLVIGEGEERARLEAHIRDLDIDDNVILLGHIQNAASLLSAFDLYLLPSLSEALAYVIMEAGAAGVPIVASRVGGIPEMLEEDGGFLIPARNPEVLADSIENILQSPKEALARAATFKARVLSYFTTKRMIEETTDLYHSLLR